MGVIGVMGDTVAIGDGGCITSCVGRKRRRRRGELLYEREGGGAGRGRRERARREEGIERGALSIWIRPVSYAPPTDRLRAASPWPAALRRSPIRRTGGRKDTMQPPPQRQRIYWAELDYSHPLCLLPAAYLPTWILQTVKRTEHFLPRWVAPCIVSTLNMRGSNIHPTHPAWLFWLE